MLSWPARLSLVYLWAKKLFSPPPGANVSRSRQDMERTARTFGASGSWQVTQQSLGDLKAEWLVAHDSIDDRVVLFLHGGSYISGSPETHRGMVGFLAVAAGGRCLSLDYRLAPENSFPAALEDARRAYEWLLAQGLPARRIALAGDSAGGGLSLALLVTLRDASLPLPAAAILFCPWTDLAMTGETLHSLAKKDLILHRETLRQEAQLYLAGADPRHPLASPLYADLHSLPPLLIQAGEHDILLSDSTRLADRLQSAGVAVTLEIGQQMQHDYQYAAGQVPEARQAVARAGAFIQRHIP
jgi:acetyl esterase/lipase